MTLHTAPFHRVLYRPALLMGGDRLLTGPTAVVAAGLTLLGQNRVAFIVAALLWFGAMYWFREMAKADAQLRAVYLRQIRYRDYYPARSRPYVGMSQMSLPVQIATLVAAPLAFFAFIYWRV